jgi:RNA polymerase sigma-70 factor (sigma-E family)
VLRSLPGSRGDDAQLAELYAAHRLSLVRLAILLVDDFGTAEDVVQDAFAAFAARRTALRDANAALGYLRISVVNGARSTLRRRRTARGYTPPHEVEPDGPDARAVLSEEHRQVLEGLKQLAPRQREVLVLRYWSGLSEGEIAEALDISRGTVKSTASRALTALQKLLPHPEEGTR